MNYFELFELPVQVMIDKATLQKKYVELQKRYHPDFFTKEDADSQEEALEKSAAVNKAYKLFRDPDATLFYILELKGVAASDEKYQLPPDFLMEVMELNENLSENSAAAVEAFEQSIAAEVSNLIKDYNDEQVTASELQDLKAYYYKKKYLQRILDRIDG